MSEIIGDNGLAILTLLAILLFAFNQGLSALETLKRINEDPVVLDQVHKNYESMKPTDPNKILLDNLNKGLNIAEKALYLLDPEGKRAITKTIDEAEDSFDKITGEVDEEPDGPDESPPDVTVDTGEGDDVVVVG